MLFNNLTLLGALMLLPLSFGQPRGNPAHDNGRNGRRFPPMQRNHGVPHQPPDAPPPPHHGLRHRRMANETNAEESKPRFECGENPLVRLESGCPCFTLDTITSQIDSQARDSYCYLYASTPVDEDDECKHLLPPAYASFSVSTYTDTKDSGVYFGYDSHYDPEMKGGYCYGDVYEYKYNYDDDGDGSYYGDYQGESHGFSLGLELSEEELQECEKVFEELEAELADNPNCFVEIGSGYYY